MPGLLLMESTAHESDERFRALAQAAWEGIYFSEKGVIVEANPQLAEMLGYDPEDLIGMPLLECVAPGSQAAVLRAMRTGSTARYEHQAVRKDGTVITVEARGQIVSYRGRPVRITAIRDITDRVRAADRRRSLVAGTAGVSGEHFFRSLVKHLARALNAKTAFVGEISPDGERMRSLSAWVGDGYADQCTFALEGTPSAEVVAHGLRFYDARITDWFPRDAVIAALGVTSYAGIPLHDASGAVLGVLAVAHDAPLRLDDELVSTLRIFAARAAVEIERIRADTCVRRLNQELEQRVAQRTQELRAANHELEAFCYSVSHDLRAPLRQIAGFVELLERESQSSLTGAARQHLADIADSAEKMAGLIDTLLEFSRMGGVAICKRDIDLSEIVADVVRELSREAKDRVVDWVIAPLPRVWCDAALMRQVVCNLLSNALKYSRPRSPARIEVGVLASAEPGDVVCYVRDNGVGFDMRCAHRLFGVFQRLHSASLFEGTGIGLANVHRIVHRHGGRVWAVGEVGAGATFYFALPCGDSA